MNKRTYTKLYVNKNREEGSEKIFLGYQNNSTEYVLRKNTETYFHIPPYTDPVVVSESTLVLDGAIGGTFPAASDRIFESRKGYGNVSNNGNPTEVPDGTFFCSWLYRDPLTGNFQWKDRYFNSKKLNINLNEPEFSTGTNFLLKAPPVFVDTYINPSEDLIVFDVPSTMVLQPTVLYKYYHVGEKSADELVTTFEGLSSQYNLFKIKDWQTYTAQNYLSSVTPINIDSSAPLSTLFRSYDSSLIAFSSTLNFNHTYDITSYINWSTDYLPSHDFTLGGWFQSNIWSESPSTQLFGNFTSIGGFGVFADTLETYPFFVVSETSYGHLLYINQDIKGYTDKTFVTKQPSVTRGIPLFTVLDSNNNVIVCTDSLSSCLYRTDSSGYVLSMNDNNFSLSTNETPIGLHCDGSDNVILVTTAATYTFDNLLNLTLSSLAPLPLQTATAFYYDPTTKTATLTSSPNSLDLKYVNQIKWDIKTDGNVYKNDQLFFKITDGATNLQVGPNGNLWVLHGTNNVSVFNPYGISFTDPLYTFNVGLDINHEQKSISFIKRYNRSTKTSEWLSVINYSDSHYIYTNHLDGKVDGITDIVPLINFKISQLYKEQTDQFVFSCKGDYTGYEYKRVFNSVNYNNRKQLTLKVALRDKLSPRREYKIFKASVSALEDWFSQTWKHIIVTHKNKTLKLYVDSLEIARIDYSGRYELTYEQQPSFFFGSPVGSKNGLNKEIGSVACLFDGSIGEIRLYNYCIDPFNYELFLRAKEIGEDMLWSLPIPSISYVEKIERMFKNKLPGSKSNFYNLKISGTGITDPITRSLFEKRIREIIKEIAPGSSELVKIIWVG